MSEEQNVETNDGTWSGLKKTIIGVATTAVMAGGTYFTTTLFGGHDKEETKTEQVAPAAAPVINLNVDNSSKNMANGGGGATTSGNPSVISMPKAMPPKPLSDVATPALIAA